MSVEEKKMATQSYALEGGKFKVVDTDFFIKTLSAMHSKEQGMSTPEAIKAYEELKQLGRRLMKKVANEINMPVPEASEWDSIIGEAVALLMRDIKLADKEQSASITTFLYNKLKAAIKAYNTEQNYLRELPQYASEMNREMGIASATRNLENSESKEFELYKEDSSSEDIILSKDFRERQFIAFRVAMAGLPRVQQIILFQTGAGVDPDDIAKTVGLDRRETTELRDQAMALLFQRAMRSSHLTDDEKEEVLSLHGLNTPECKAELHRFLKSTRPTFNDNKE